MRHAQSDTTIEPDLSKEGMNRDEPTAFESRLALRTTVPAERLHEFLSWPIDKLRRESKHDSRMLKRIAEAVVNSMENFASTNVFLRDLDLKSISRDHDWRTIFSTMRAHETGHDGYKRTVFIRYLQYLSFRKRLLGYICSRKQGFNKLDACADELTQYPSPPPMPAGDAGPVNGNGLCRLNGEFRRMPMGEALEIPVGKGEKLDIMLAGHLFRIIGGHPPNLIDQDGVTYFLKDGRNMVGRHPESDVCIAQNLSDISRVHAIVEWQGSDRITVIDLSARGTYIRQKMLEAALTLDTPDHAFDLTGWENDDKEEVTIN